MREEIRNLDDMSDSRELLEAKPNPIIPLFIYILISLIIIAFIWTYFGEIDEVARAQGVVRTEDSISTIRTQSPGEVDEIYFTEGQVVEEGDILFTLNRNDSLLQTNIFEDELEEVEAGIDDLSLLRNSIVDGVDYFKKNGHEDSEVYERYLAYENSLSYMDKEFESLLQEANSNRDEQAIQIAYLESKIAETTSNVNQLTRLQEALHNGKNVFNESDTLYYNRFVDFELSINDLNSRIENAKSAYEQAEEQKEENEKMQEELQQQENMSGAVEESELVFHKKLDENQNILEITGEQVVDLQNQYEMLKQEKKRYINDQRLLISNEMKQEEEQLGELKVNLESYKSSAINIESSEDILSVSKKTTKTDYLIEINSEIQSLEQQKRQFDQEISKIELKSEDSVLKAPIDGVIHVQTEVNRGDYLHEGTEVITIVPQEDADFFKIQLSVKNEDIANIKIGDKINFRLHALPYQQYGQLTGEITGISSDAVYDQESEVSYYVVNASIENKQLTSYKGVESGIRVGMTTDAHIILESKKILHYLLEKVNLRD